MDQLPVIKDQFSNTDLFVAFKTQMIKDFEQSNFPSDFVNSLKQDYGAILKTIEYEIKRSQTKSDYNMMQLLYRVDISEELLKKYLNKNKDQDSFETIAELVIKRILQKVVMKQYFKSNHL